MSGSAIGPVMTVSGGGATGLRASSRSTSDRTFGGYQHLDLARGVSDVDRTHPAEAGRDVTQHIGAEAIREHETSSALAQQLDHRVRKGNCRCSFGATDDAAHLSKGRGLGRRRGRSELRDDEGDEKSCGSVHVRLRGADPLQRTWKLTRAPSTSAGGPG